MGQEGPSFELPEAAIFLQYSERIAWHSRDCEITCGGSDSIAMWGVVKVGRTRESFIAGGQLFCFGPDASGSWNALRPSRVGEYGVFQNNPREPIEGKDCDGNLQGIFRDPRMQIFEKPIRVALPCAFHP
jgi:hypothetical protein